MRHEGQADRVIDAAAAGIVLRFGEAARIFTTYGHFAGWHDSISTRHGAGVHRAIVDDGAARTPSQLRPRHCVGGDAGRGCPGVPRRTIAGRARRWRHTRPWLARTCRPSPRRSGRPAPGTPPMRSRARSKPLVAVTPAAAESTGSLAVPVRGMIQNFAWNGGLSHVPILTFGDSYCFINHVP